MTDQQKGYISQPLTPAKQVDLLKVLAVLEENKRVIFGFAAGTLLLGILAAFILNNQYSSSTSFVPPSSGQSNAMAMIGQLSSMGAGSLLTGSAMKSPGELYVGILKSRSIAETIIKRFDLKRVYGVRHDEDAIKRLGARTQIVVSTKSSIITLTVTDKNAERARDIANAYLTALQDTNGRLALTEASQKRLFFDQQLKKERSALADAEENLKQGKEKNGLIIPSGQAAIQIEAIAKLQAQIAAQEIQLSDLMQSSTDQNPMVIRLKGVISDLKNQLAQKQHGEPNIGNIPASKVPSVQMDYLRLEREVKYHETLFEIIARQDEAARMDEARDSPVLQIIDSANIPEEPSGPPPTLLVIGSLILGLLLGTTFVLVKSFSQSPHTLLQPAGDLTGQH